jgi:hypothetical protein
MDTRTRRAFDRFSLKARQGQVCGTVVIEAEAQPDPEPEPEPTPEPAPEPQPGPELPGGPLVIIGGFAGLFALLLLAS